MSITSRPDAVIFDLDGTLANTFSYMLECFASALEPDLGRNISREEMLAQFQLGFTEPVIINELSGFDNPAAAERYFAGYAAAHDRVQLFPGVADALAACHAAGVKLGVMTGKSRLTAELTLRQLEVRDYFGVVVSGDEATRPKPDPMGLRLALSALAVAPEHAIFVGDTRADVRAARAAGTGAVLCAWNNPDDAAEVAALYPPDAIFASGDDLAEWLRKLLDVAELSA
jgi:pyrophosphatase PpaX